MADFLQSFFIGHQIKTVGAKTDTQQNIGHNEWLAGKERERSQHGCTGKDQKNGKEQRFAHGAQRLIGRDSACKLSKFMPLLGVK